MSISDDVKGWLKLLLGLVLAGAVTWGTFRGKTESRVSANEKSIGQHEVKLDKLAVHAARSENDMDWMKQTVRDYDAKQETVLEAIKDLKK